MAGALSLLSLEKSFGNARVLDGVTLEIEPGEFVALVGPSGCGKSTLLRIAAGLERPDDGRVLLGEEDVTARRAADRDIAMVFQSYALYPHLTARQNMALPLVMRRVRPAGRWPLVGRWLPGVAGSLRAIQAEVESAAEGLRITALLDRKPGQMSGGQRQRVALGRALVREPRAFLMDEPLSNLDASLRVHMRSEIVELQRRLGATTLYVTHDQEEALSMADRVAVMGAGRLLQVAPPAVVYGDPAHLEVAAFIGSPRINTLPLNVSESGRCAFAGQLLRIEAPAGAGATVTLGVRPEHWSVHAERQTGALAARVRRTEFLGVDRLVHLDLAGAPETVVVRLPPERAAALAPGAETFIAPLPGAALLFDGAGARLRAPALSATRAA